MKRILVLDNFDSFTFNLVHLLREMEGVSVEVRRNHIVRDQEVEKVDALVLSPGPGVPREAGRMLDILARFRGKLPILGVCLGHQAIGEVYGATLRNLNEVMHGRESILRILDRGDVFYRTLPDEVVVGRYHSWVLERSTLPNSLVVTAEDSEGEIMSIRSKSDCIAGVQFHPESVMTPHGAAMLRAWVCEEVRGNE